MNPEDNFYPHIARIANQIVNQVGEEPWIRAKHARWDEAGTTMLEDEKTLFDQDKGFNPSPRRRFWRRK